jgi:hypothetical protein
MGFRRAEERLASISRNGTLSIVLACLVWVCWQAFYAVPAADDFCYGVRAMTDGLIRGVVSEYMGWSGRFSATFLMEAFAGSSELLTRQYFLVPWLILLLNLVGARHFLISVGTKDRAFLLVFFVALIATYSMREAVFWLAGGFTYGIACAIFLPLIGEELKLFLGEIPPSWKRTLVLCVASLLLAGFNEVVMVAHVALLGLLFFSSAFHKKNPATVRAIGFILLAAIIGAFIVKFAPGNAIRSAHVPNAPNLFHALENSFIWTFQRYSKPFLLSVFLFYSALIVFAPKINRDFRAGLLLELLLFLLCALWASLFTRAYVFNDLGPARSQTVDYMLVNLIAFLTACYPYTKYGAVIVRARPILPVLFIFIGAFLATLCLRFNADGIIWKDYLPRMKDGAPWKEYMAARFDMVQKGKGEILRVPDYGNKQRPITLFDDIRDDPKAYQNRCFADYFGLKDVYLEKSH